VRLRRHGLRFPRLYFLAGRKQLSFFHTLSCGLTSYRRSFAARAKLESPGLAGSLDRFLFGLSGPAQVELEQSSGPLRPGSLTMFTSNRLPIRRTDLSQLLEPFTTFLVAHLFLLMGIESICDVWSFPICRFCSFLTILQFRQTDLFRRVNDATQSMGGRVA